MLQIIGLTQLISLVAVCYLEFQVKSRAIFFWGTLLIMIGIPQFIEMTITSDINKLFIMAKASLFMIIFNIMYLITRGLIVSKNEITFKGLSSHSSFNEKFISKSFLIVLSLSLGMLLSIAIVHFGGIGQATWGRFYIFYSQLNLLHPYRLNSYVFFGVAGIGLYFLLKKKYLWASISMLIIFSVAMISGNRIQILPLIVGIAIVVIIKSKGIGFKKTIQLSLLALTTVYIVYMLRVIRIKGSLEYFISTFNLKEINEMILNQIIGDDGELGLRNAFYYFIQFNNNFPGFNEGASYVRILLFWLPTQLSGGIKPPDFAVSMGTAYSGDFSNTTFSMHPTFYGDLFANFWWYGVLLAIFWAFVFKYFDKLINHLNLFPNIFLTVTVCSAYIIFARGSLYNGFFMLITSTLFFYVIYVMLGILLNFIKKNKTI
ncbi:O-antigen polymerase [Caryophanon tenue]|uniref:Oligosaccharide repeat unit polymerase n=1 Tax=Caryophanon tenue TaxID=33978 RepID=A0A1C0Y7Z2_9BACL|nr:O-antigen polymerase [Caryophanon tenue]OCS83281.1 hypothetical protein A6M13_04460 [Caryophanon tenue]